MQRLRFGTECLLGAYGTEVVSKHMELRRLANCILTIYAMIAIVGKLTIWIFVDRKFDVFKVALHLSEEAFTVL